MKLICGSAAVSLAETVLGSGCLLRLRVYGTSMLPFVRPGDIVQVQPIQDGNKEVRIGDIIVYCPAWGGVAAHRILRKCRLPNGTPAFLVRGDHFLSGREHVEVQHVLGKVVMIERKQSYDFATTRLAKATRYMCCAVIRSNSTAVPCSSGIKARRLSVVEATAPVAR